MILAGLLLFVPISLVLGYWVHASPLLVFVTGAIAIITLANWIRRATDNLASGAGPAIGGLVNVTFGSIAELILALFVLARGDTAIVKAQITGSLIGTSLLGLGAAIIVEGWKREKQVFQRERAGLLGSLLILSIIGLMLPALFDYTERSSFAHPNTGALDEKLSLSVSVILILVYLANLVYTLVTHPDVFAPRKSQEKPEWPVWKSLGDSTRRDCCCGNRGGFDCGEPARDRKSGRPWFLGITVLAVIGNAAEIIAAMYFARQDRMNLVMGLCIGSTVQVALLLAPALVLISHFIGHPMNLVFTNPLDLIAVAGAVLVVNSIASDGETTWFEGVLLVSVYALFGLAFFFATP